MKIYLEQLTAQLKQQLAPVYCLSGDETLLIEQARHDIRQACSKAGLQERKVFYVETGFDWQAFLMEALSLSLFSQTMLIELRIEKLNEAGKKALLHYLEHPPADKVLLIETPSLDAKEQQSAWYKTCEKIGLCINVRPMTATHFPAWLNQQAQRLNLNLSPEALRWLAELTEGNLLAANQALEKLYLLFDKQRIEREHVMDAISAQSHYSIFDLVDTTLQGDTARLFKILTHLKSEGTDPILIIWSFTRELRSLTSMQDARQSGTPLAQVLQQYRVWDKRKPLTQLALQRHNKTSLIRLIKHAGYLDSMVKGGNPGNIWNELEQWCWQIAKGKALI